MKSVMRLACIALLLVIPVAECADDLAESSTVPASTAPATNTSPEAPVTSNGTSIAPVVTSGAPVTSNGTSIAPVVTSGAPVTSNGTSEAPATTSGAPVTKNGTTEAPVTTVPPTTQPPVTMPPPPPPAPYEVMKDGKACIIMVASLQLDVLYEKKDNKTDSGYLNVPSNATVTGKCAGVNDTMSTMTISFGRVNAARSLTFDFMKSGDGNAMLSSVAVLVDLDSKEFPNAKSGKLNETLNDLKLLQTKENFFFKCDSEQIIAQDDVKDVKIFIRNLQVQAFGIKNGSMSKDGYECTGDTAPIPKSAETAKVNVTEDGNTCIVFNGALTLQIPYNTSTGSKTASINIPQNLSVSGSCGNNGTNTQYLEMNFYDGWKLRLTFQSDAKTSGLLKAAQAGDSYQLSKADLTYVLNNNLFPDVVNPGETAELSGNFTSDALKAKSKGSYLCSKDQTFDLGNGFKMTTKDMQFEAFMSKEFKGFGEASECAKDDETNSIIPIAVGAALAGLVIIVLIAYLIGRRRSRGGYEQV